MYAAPKAGQGCAKVKWGTKGPHPLKIMSEGIIVGAVVAVVLVFCLLGFLIYKVGMARVEATNSVMQTLNTLGQNVRSALDAVANESRDLRHAIERGAEHFAPVRDIPCTKCGGTGMVEKENPLWAAIAESLEANAAAARRGRK